jgi:hypothetical protein
MEFQDGALFQPPAEKAPGGKALEEAQAFLQKLRSRRDKEESAGRVSINV